MEYEEYKAKTGKIYSIGFVDQHPLFTSRKIDDRKTCYYETFFHVTWDKRSQETCFSILLPIMNISKEEMGQLFRKKGLEKVKIELDEGNERHKDLIIG